jgi:hypothetical protein
MDSHYRKRVRRRRVSDQRKLLEDPALASQRATLEFAEPMTEQKLR